MMKGVPPPGDDWKAGTQVDRRRLSSMKGMPPACANQAQPLFPDFFFSFLVLSAAPGLPAEVFCGSASIVVLSLSADCSALTALLFFAPQPLAVAGFSTLVPPALGLAPQPLPAWAPGRVTPPMLMSPATPNPAKNRFSSFVSITLLRLS
jgi:hypothetical protein